MNKSKMDKMARELETLQAQLRSARKEGAIGEVKGDGSEADSKQAEEAALETAVAAAPEASGEEVGEGGGRCAGAAEAGTSDPLAKLRAKVKCCGRSPMARRVTATREVASEIAPARCCPLTNACAASRMSRSSLPCSLG